MTNGIEKADKAGFTLTSTDYRLSADQIGLNPHGGQAVDSLGVELTWSGGLKVTPSLSPLSITVWIPKEVVLKYDK